MAAARGIGVACRLHGTEVVARSDDHGVDAVIDALVMGRGTVSVDMGDVNRLLELHRIFRSGKMLVNAIELFHRAFHPDLHPTVGRVVREDRHDGLTLP